MRKFYVLPLFLSGCLFFDSDQNNVEGKDTSTTDMNVDVAVTDMGDAGQDSGPTDVSLDLDTPDVTGRTVIVVTSDSENAPGVCPDASACTFSEAIRLARIDADLGGYPKILFDVGEIESNVAYEINFPVEIIATGVTLNVTTEGTALRLSNGVTLTGLTLTGIGAVGIEISESELSDVAVDEFGIGVQFVGPGILNDAVLKNQNAIGVQLQPTAKNVVLTNAIITAGTGLVVPSPTNYMGEREPVLVMTDGSISSATVVGASLERDGIIIDNVTFESNAIGVDINVPRVMASPMRLPIKMTSSTLIKNQFGLRVRSANELILGGTLEKGNRIAGNTQGSLDAQNTASLRLEGSSFGFDAAGKLPEANQEGPSFSDIDMLFIGERPPNPLVDCRAKCNLFGPTTGQFATVRVQNSNFEFHGNFIGTNKDRSTVFPSTKSGLFFRDTGVVNISNNRIVAFTDGAAFRPAAAISFTGKSEQPTGVTNVIENNFLGSISGPVDRGINFDSNFNDDIGLWDFNQNEVKHAEFGIVVHGNMAGGNIHNNTITDTIAVAALSIRAPNLKITSNRLTAPRGLYLYGQEIAEARGARNVLVLGNVFGGKGNVGVAIQHAPKEIEISGNNIFQTQHAIDILQQTSDKNINSGAVRYFGNTFLESLVPVAFRNLAGDPSGLVNDINDIDIGPNTLLNSPVVTRNTTVLMEGDLSVSGAEVLLYEKNISGNIKVFYCGVSI